MDLPTTELSIALLIPCHNEESTIGKVIEDFSDSVPNADIYVYDNNSSDHTAEIAEHHGANLRFESLQGKGNVVRRMFSDIDADIYILVDGDNTYDAQSAPNLINELVNGNTDMVNARRLPDTEYAYPPGHALGNQALSGIVGMLFGRQIRDILSGYRVFSRRFVKSFPALSTGFEIETELTIHALSLNMPVSEIDTPYKARKEGSLSKLNTFKDGARILKTITTLLKEERPVFFFGIGFSILATLSLALGIPIVMDWIETGKVERFPTAILSASIMILAFISMASGVILSSVSRSRKEMKRLHYLAVPWLGKKHD